MTQLEFIEMHQLIDQYEQNSIVDKALSIKDYNRMNQLKHQYDQEERRVKQHAGV